MWMSWFGILRCCAPPQRVMGLFGCTHKTIAIGIPLINALYEDSPQSKALYALPLLVWHPIQLVLGTLLTPYLVAYVQANTTTTTTTTPDNNNDNNNTTTAAGEGMLDVVDDAKK
jgi:solute carrier family 10 (sodium/bile acid cotransporter), member 7